MITMLDLGLMLLPALLNSGVAAVVLVAAAAIVVAAALAAATGLEAGRAH
jgi:hypothetical protein